MRVSEYSYNLPSNLIVSLPPEVRGDSRLLVVSRSDESLQDKRYRDIVGMLRGGDLVVLNDTKVVKARLFATKPNGAVRELLVLEKHSYDEDWLRHRVIYRGKLIHGDVLKVGGAKLIVEEVLDGGIAIINSDVSLLDLLQDSGEVPLPPYMHRKSTEEDETRYQTVWAKSQGSVAAPTASLNMTKETLDQLRKKGVKVAFLTLHVGMGTFLPIRDDDIEDHVMHKEYFEIPKETAELIRYTKVTDGRVVAVGTTVARTLEYSHKTIMHSTSDICGEADIFIYPGYQFKMVDALLTNFHAPKSTVLMLASAFAGWDLLMKAYEHAISNKYKFLSYGDSMLIL